MKHAGVIGVIVFVTGSVPCFGQAFTANLTGLITDPSSGVVPHAKVELANTATNEKRTASTSSDGRYRFSQLLPGSYELSARKPLDSRSLFNKASRLGQIRPPK